MAAILQSPIPQQSTSSLTVLQSQSSSSSSSASSPTSRSQTMPWSTSPSASSSTSNQNNYYRSSRNVVAPYAFTSTPTLTPSTTAPAPPTSHNRRSSWSPHPHLSHENRTFSAPSVSPDSPHASHHSNSHAAGSASTRSPSFSSSPISKDDTAIPSRHSNFSDSHSLRSLSSSLNLTASSASSSSSKPSPDRYRRPSKRSDSFTDAPQPSRPYIPSPTTQQGSTGRNSTVSVATPTEKQPSELAKRYRRRSSGTLDVAARQSASPDLDQIDASDLRLPEIVNTPPIPNPAESTGSLNSGYSSNSSV